MNLKSAFLCTQAVLPNMRSRHWGRIVNISSGAARGAGGIGVHYNASKAGMEGLTRGYAARLVKEGITVNAVAPSLIDTDMMNARRDQYVARIPLGRMGTVEEVAQAVLMVIGNEYMTRADGSAERRDQLHLTSSSRPAAAAASSDSLRMLRAAPSKPSSVSFSIAAVSMPNWHAAKPR